VPSGYGISAAPGKSNKGLFSDHGIDAHACLTPKARCGSFKTASRDYLGQSPYT